MKTQRTFLRLQLFCFVLLILLLSGVSFYLFPHNQFNFQKNLETLNRSHSQVSDLFDRAEADFYVGQRAGVRWLATGQNEWLDLSKQAREAFQLQFDLLSMRIAQGSVSSLKQTLDQTQKDLGAFWGRVDDMIAHGQPQDHQVQVQIKQFFSADASNLLSALGTLQTNYDQQVQATTTLLHQTYALKLKYSLWALAGCCGLLLIWALLIGVQFSRHKTVTAAVDAEPTQAPVDEVCVHAIIDLMPLSYLSTPSFTDAAMAVFGEDEDCRSSSVVSLPLAEKEVQSKEDGRQSADNGIRNTLLHQGFGGQADDGIQSDDEEENTEKTHLVEDDNGGMTEDEVLKEVDQILAQEIPGVDFGRAAANSRPSSVNGIRNADDGIRKTSNINLTAPAANDYPDVILALHQDYFTNLLRIDEGRKTIKMPRVQFAGAREMFDKISLPEVKVVNGASGEEVITVDFDQERNDLALKFKKRVRR